MRLLAIAVVLVLATTPVSADHIGLYTDPYATLCAGPLAAPPVINFVYVIDEGGAGARASKWRIAHELALLSVSFSLTNPYLPLYPIGDPLGNGVTVDYLDCRPSPYVIGSVGFMYFGAPFVGCDQLRVEKHLGDDWYPAEETIVVFDCEAVAQPATGGKFSFVFTPGQICDTCAPLPVESATWGSVKALYR